MVYFSFFNVTLVIAWKIDGKRVREKNWEARLEINIASQVRGSTCLNEVLIREAVRIGIGLENKACETCWLEMGVKSPEWHAGFLSEQITENLS